MIVPAGVVVRGPAEQPHVDVLVTMQRDVVAFVGAECQVVLPLSRLRGKPGGELGQFAAFEVATGQAFDVQALIDLDQMLGATCRDRKVREWFSGHE